MHIVILSRLGGSVLHRVENVSVEFRYGLFSMRKGHVRLRFGSQYVCLFVRAGRRGQGVTHALVRAAVELACREGASAIEGWPLAGSERRSDDAFVGREQVFEDLGFSCVERPSPERVIMRLELRGSE